MNDEPQHRGGPAGHGGRGDHAGRGGRARRGAGRRRGGAGGRGPTARGAPGGPGRSGGATRLPQSPAARAAHQEGPGSGGSGDGGGGRQGRRARRKERRRARLARRKGLRRLVPTWRMVLGGFGVLLVLVVGAFVAGYLLVAIPSANAAATAQSNVFLYSDGTQLARDGDINRENASLARIPKSVQHAVLAAEDRDFYSEPGVDPLAMIRALWNTVSGKGRQSGSTITQQYVKNYYLDQKQTVTRKVKELFIAIKLDREESKKDIFQGYLNTSYFGRNTYGIQAAAQAYYGVDAARLSTAQAAYLASLLNAPSAYDVVAHPENKPRALARWNYVLDGMVKQHWLSSAERARAAFPTPKPARVQSGLSGQRGYVVQAVKEYLTSHHIIDERAHGYRITTTLRRRPQEAFSEAVDEELLSRLDKRERPVDRTVRAGGVAVDPATGKVIAMYGGIDYTKQFVNNATRRDYQVGSAFKPFVFAAAVQHGARTHSGDAITPNATYDGTNRRAVQGWSGTRYAPQNEDDRSYGSINVRTATDKSVNAVYAQMAVDVGPAKVRSTAVDLGIPEDTHDMPEGPAIALGTATASALDLAQAYSTLANHGERVPYTLVEKVTKDGHPVRLPRRERERAVTREAADTTTSVLQGVVDGGTGTAAQAAGHPAAGKTGTAEDDMAAWFAGYTPDLTTVVTVMGQNPRTGAHTSLYGALGEPRINGGGYPARIWARFTADALAGTSNGFELQLQPGADESASPSPGDSPSAGPAPTDTGTGTGTGTDRPGGIGGPGAGGAPGAGRPRLPGVPGLPGLPAVPGVPGVPGVPDLRELPDWLRPGDRSDGKGRGAGGEGWNGSPADRRTGPPDSGLGTHRVTGSEPARREGGRAGTGGTAHGPGTPGDRAPHAPSGAAPGRPGGDPEGAGGHGGGSGGTGVGAAGAGGLVDGYGTGAGPGGAPRGSGGAARPPAPRP